MTVLLRILGPDEEVPKVGTCFKIGADEWLRIYVDGNRDNACTVMHPPSIPFIEELMALARRGEELSKPQTRPEDNVSKMAPDPIISAIREVGAGIIEAIGEHAEVVGSALVDKIALESPLKEIYAIAGKVRKGGTKCST